MSSQGPQTNSIHLNGLVSNVDGFVIPLGAYVVKVGAPKSDDSPLSIWKGPKRVFYAPESEDWLVGYIDGYALPESRGFFFPKPLGHVSLAAGYGTQVSLDKDGIMLKGRSDYFEWSVHITLTDDESICLSIDTNMARVVLTSRRKQPSRIFGLGHQFTHVNLDGKRVPMISQEPGIGRGIQPLTFFMQRLFGAGGSDVQSSAPVPFFFTDSWNGYFLDTCSVSFLDFSVAGSMVWDINTNACDLYLLCQSTPADLVSQYTARVGRMRPLPDWIHQGAIIGLQGGSKRLKQIHTALTEAESAIAGYWLQDWVGQRKTSIGWQLWWNWELDEQHYPDWHQQRAELADEGIRLLSYVNPFLVDGSQKAEVRRHLFAEARDQGFLVSGANQAPYEIGNTSFNAYLVDLTNEAARDWLKAIIVEQILGTGVHGFMADFGEALPADARLFDNRDAAIHHNEYPIEWARLIDEAIETSDRKEIVPFHRSAYHRSPRFVRLFWLGDQLISWRREDGIKSAVAGLISGGLSGFSLSHSDIGGYTSTDLLPLSIQIPGISFRRGRELLVRWIELNAFTPVFRTHEGNQPSKNVQVFDTPELLETFSYFSRVFAALFEYRRSEMSSVESHGWGLVRPVWFHYPDDERLLDVCDAFGLGRSVFVFPILNAGAESVTVRLPQGEYVHVFTGESYQGGRDYLVSAPIGQPAVFVDLNSAWCQSLVEAVKEIPRPGCFTS